jgi:hypothetical protein
MFMFSLAKELGTTVTQLSQVLTREEMIGWAAYFKIQSDDMERDRDAVQRSSASRTQTR